MPKKEGLETIKISQDIDNLFFSQPKQTEIYIDYTIFDLAQNLADFTGLTVELEINQKIIVRPTGQEPTKETLTEVKN